MHYSSLFVLSTLAIGQAAAASPRHASFHARRSNAAKRNAGDEFASVNWKEAVKWSEVDYSGVDFSKGNKNPDTPTAPIVPSTLVAPTTTTTAPPKKAPAAVETPKAPKSHPLKEAVSDIKDAIKDVKDNIKEALDDFVNGDTDGIEALFPDVGIGRMGVNSFTNNGQVWLGDDSSYKTTFVNHYSEDIILVCWTGMGFTVNVNQPLITVKIPTGKAQKVAFGSVSGACTAAYKGLTKSSFGGLANTWFEFTMGNQWATFDVSREPNMKGISMSAQADASGCLSDMETCVFKCKDKDICGQAGEYQMYGVDNTKNCGHNTELTDGGCGMGNGGDHITVTFS